MFTSERNICSIIKQYRELEPKMDSIVRVLHGIIDCYRNVLLVCGAVGAGVVVPQFGSYLEPIITPLVVFLVFTSVVGLRPNQINVSSYIVVIVVSLGISYVVLPAGGMQVANAILTDGAALGFAIALSVPTTTGSAIIWTRLSKGDVQLATTISIISLLAAPLLTPVILSQLAGSQATVPVVPILTELLIIVGGGVVLAALIPSRFVPPRLIDGGATVAILVLIYTSVAGVESGMLTGKELVAIFAVSVGLLGFGLIVSMFCKRGLKLSRTKTIPLFFTSSLKNLGIALLIAHTYADPLVTLSIITYYVVQQVSSAVLADHTF